MNQTVARIILFLVVVSLPITAWMMTDRGLLYPASLPFIFVISGLLLSLLWMNNAKVLKPIQSLEIELAEERDRLNAIIASMGEGVLVIDTHHRLKLINKTAEKFIGVKAQDVIGKNLEDFLQLFRGSEQVPLEDRPIIKTLKTGKAYQFEFNDDYAYQGPNGKTCVLAGSTTPLKENGSTRGAVVVFRDITEEKRIDAAKTNFISIASHQLQGPLSAISWFAEILLTDKKAKLTGEQRKAIESIYQSDLRMIELVQALLHISMVEMGTYTPAMQSVNLKDVVTFITNDLSRQIEGKKLLVKTRFAAHLTEVHTDAKLIQIIIQNLFSNAVKYTPPKGTISLHFSLKDILNTNNLCIEVADTGYGIPQNQQKKLFTKFFRADNIKLKEPEGTGLGLYIVHSVVERLNGTISFVTEENKGTTFTVCIPTQTIQQNGAKKSTTKKRV